MTAANTTVDPPDDIGYPTDVSSPAALQFGMELARIASDNKSSDVVVLDLRGISQVTDFTVIATGTSNRQMRAVVDAAIEYGKKVGQRPYGCAGYESASWIVIDYVDVVFHVFIQSFREYYDLELLWGDAPQIAWAKSESA